MYNISTITTMKKMDFGVWNVVFTMDDHPLEYTTDFLYLLKEKKWVVNSLITHELTSLMLGNECRYCGKDKIACFATSGDYKVIKQNIIKHVQFQNGVKEELDFIRDEITSDITVVNNKEQWQQLADDNRFYGNVLRVQNKNN